MLTGGGRLEINGPLAGGFRFANLASYRDVNFLPGAVKYGELPALLALSAPQRLLVLGETEASLDTVIAAYAASERSRQLSIDKGHQQGLPERIVHWLKRANAQP